MYASPDSCESGCHDAREMLDTSYLIISDHKPLQGLREADALYYKPEGLDQHMNIGFVRSCQKRSDMIQAPQMHCHLVYISKDI